MTGPPTTPQAGSGLPGALPAHLQPSSQFLIRHVQEPLRLLHTAEHHFGRAGSAVVLLLFGGDKSTQRADIRRAQAYWANYLEAINRGKTK